MEGQIQILIDYILKASIQDIHLEKAAFLMFVTA